MSGSFFAFPEERHVRIPDVGRARPAKVEPADVRNPDIVELLEDAETITPARQRVGAAVKTAIDARFDSYKVAAARIAECSGEPLDEAELRKWLSGKRRPHFDRLLAVPELVHPLLLAEIRAFAPTVELTTSARFPEGR